ncbi:hypothetical protein E4M02_06685 [Brevundimonas sp. S30B]|uniref:hypothetical protein n=1 Tax=unclassified Brevundimonas TaxID=2622653 RepID=UPI001071B83D|nr:MULTISPECIES: hypothetical protein [unclassified Brevundimonas]QBX37970.1 hypothetical protein E4M01_09455 [Brevundimonas sp. MF30-B]TFW02675.1 hypothetical protein E4M02_06685 [Brevundimonas sp. S30B]
MTLGGFPIYLYAPVAIACVLGVVMTMQFVALAKTMGIKADDPADSKRLNAALFGGEQQLHDLGVHRSVWIIRIAFIVETACILLFIFLILRAIEAV